MAPSRMRMMIDSTGTAKRRDDDAEDDWWMMRTVSVIGSKKDDDDNQIGNEGTEDRCNGGSVKRGSLMTMMMVMLTHDAEQAQVSVMDVEGQHQVACTDDR